MPLSGQASYTELDAKLYYSTNIGTPVWVEIKRATGVKLPLSKEEVEIASRETRWKLFCAAWKELGVEFDYTKKRGEADTVYNALKASFLNDSPVLFAVMDNLISTSGAMGWKFVGQVFGFDEDQGKPVKANVKVKLTEHYESGTLQEPSFLTI